MSWFLTLMLVTAYCMGGRMSNGEQTRIGAAACPPNRAGQQLYVEGYGMARCLDRYRSDLSERIDVFMNDCHEAILWGAQKRIVWISGDEQ